MNLAKLSLFAAAASVALLAGCSKPPGSAPDQSNEAVNTVQDAASTVVGAAAAPAGAATTDGFVSNAAIANMYEIEAAKMALQRSNNAAVKKAADMILKDHEAAGAEMKTVVAGVPGVTLPTALDERHQGLLDNLRGASNTDFDRVYLDQQTSAHQEALTLFGDYADHGDNAALKAFAAKVKPKLQMHLDAVNAAKS
jgi:putative membrane protein